MTDPGPERLSTQGLGEYCRRVEDYLTRANAGHLVRIVGAGFELVRGWAESGVPLSVVFRGIDMKAERYREGRARRPLRIEFCEADVLTVFDNWRRAIGLTSAMIADERPGSEDPGRHVHDGEMKPDRGMEPGVFRPRAGAPGLETRGVADAAESKRPSLSRHLDRAVDRLSRTGGRLDLPSGLRDVCDRVLQELAAMRAGAARVRGGAREELVSRLTVLDADLADAVRRHAPAALRVAAAEEAAADLAPYRGRLSVETWQRSIEVTTDRLLRDRLGLPQLDL